MVNLGLVLSQLAGGLLLSLFLLLIYRKVGPFPNPLPTAENSKREYMEIGIVYVISFILIALDLLIYIPSLHITENHSLSIHFFLILAIPFILEVGIHRRKVSDLGLISHAQKAWHPAIVLIGFSILWGILSVLISFPVNGLTPLALILGLLTPVFIEEWQFRSFYQTKLERALDQKKACFWSGILFGVFHIPLDFFGSIWILGDRDPIFSSITLIFQIVSGWLMGVVFIKTRSIWPGVIAHFFFNYMAIIIMMLI